MKTRILSPYITEIILGSDRYVRLAADFGFYSEILGCEVWFPKGMVVDNESMPGPLRSDCPVAGGGHDGLCRKNSVPVVTKRQAADVYFELLDHIYSLNDKESNGIKKWTTNFKESWLKHIKWAIVSCWPGYFHKFNIESTYEEITS